MIYQSTDLQRVARKLTEILQEDLESAGIFFRIYSRAKQQKSLHKKLDTKHKDGTQKYDGEKKFLRDMIGVRINLYFVDDLEILLTFFKRKYSGLYVEEAVDRNADSEFKPTRVNLIFQLPVALLREFRAIVPDKRIDGTFELQLRTVFSEGWHEVEHDFRYKCQDDWINHASLSRTFNGMLAALETHEWGMIKIFEELGYSFYKTNNFGGMMRMRLRIRTEDYKLSDDLENLLASEPSFLKKFFKLERQILIEFLLDERVRLPFQLDNLVFLINHIFFQNKKISASIPEHILLIIKEIEPRKNSTESSNEAIS